MDSTTLGQRLHRARDTARLTQEQLARRIGVTRSAISQWESGMVSNISAAHLLATAKVLRVSLDWLLSGEDGMEIAEDAAAPYLYAEPSESDLLPLWRQLTTSQRTAMLAQIRELAEHNAALLAELSR
jgi:transcriptional regulator with XRE-family HTH domain